VCHRVGRFRRNVGRGVGPGVLLMLLAACGSAAGTGEPAVPTTLPRVSEVRWEPWSEESFERAERERKLILVSVQAGWCHWCHVMNRVTYRDPEVMGLLAEGFVAIRVDADARPDLAERYARWAWPATALLTPDAQPITEMRGHQPPRRFARLLRESLEDLRAGRPLERRAAPAHEPDPELSDLAALHAMVREQLDAAYDAEAHGWGGPQKYPFAAPVEHALFRARVHGETGWQERALVTLEGYAQLVDPVWGGMYQYSLEGRWDRPHYEKIAEIQAGAILAFTRAYRETRDRRWLREATGMHVYVDTWLRDPEGGFYASQDADVGTHGEHPAMPGIRFYSLDDAARRRAGAPHVDEHVYANLNGMMIRALAELSEASGDPAPLESAIAAAERLEETHAVGGGGYSHAGEEPGVLYLADQVEMARGLLALHEVTGDERWLERARRVMAFMRESLAAEDGGFWAHTEDPAARGVFAERRRPLHDNAVAARVLLHLHRLTGDDALRELATGTLRALADPRTVRRHGRKVGELLMALAELEAPWAIVSVVGPADAAGTEALRSAAVAWSHPMRLVEVGRPGDSRYPYPGEPAAYICSASACSTPITDAAELAAAGERFLAE